MKSGLEHLPETKRRELSRVCQRRCKNPQNRRSKIPQFRRSAHRVDVAIFRRAAARSGDGWWGDQGFGADVLRHELGVLPQAVA
jgi:hypothetical protein